MVHGIDSVYRRCDGVRRVKHNAGDVKLWQGTGYCECKILKCVHCHSESLLSCA